MSRLSAERIPVIVGVGEITEKARFPELCHEPIDLMARALKHAENDAGAPILAQLDSIDIVAEYSWPYDDACALLNARLGLALKRACYGEAGGESPVRFIHEAALRIASGESRSAAIVGAEANYSAAAALKAGTQPPWSPRSSQPKLLRGKDMCNPVAVAHQVVQPAHVYPLYENASHARWGQTPREALQESGDLWSRYSAIAASNHNSWLRKTYSPDEIVVATDANRLIAWPYTKHMVANPMVNQGAAVLITSLENARELGISASRWIYVWGGAAACEPRDYLKRDQYARSHAQDAVLEFTLALAGGDVGRFALVELYSCFPVVPKMARRTLGLPADAQMTSTGGLSFFGAPLNNYMTHAAAGLVRGLRGTTDKVALLYGQGEFVTKHHALVLASSPAEDALLHPDYGIQSVSDSRYGRVPELLTDYTGPASVETFTVIYQRDGTPAFGVVIALTPQNQRLMARVTSSDIRSVAHLTRLDCSPVGSVGIVTRGDNSLLHWKVLE